MFDYDYRLEDGSAAFTVSAAGKLAAGGGWGRTTLSN